MSAEVLQPSLTSGTASVVFLVIGVLSSRARWFAPIHLQHCGGCGANRERARSSVGAMRPVIVLVAALALTTVAANASALQPAKTCGVYAVRAVVGGRVSCLRDQQPCRHRFERRYQQYGFHCRS